jgi:hypothetical protein
MTARDAASVLIPAIVSGLLAGAGWVLWDAASAGDVEWREAFLFGLAFALGHASGQAWERRGSTRSRSS